MANQPSLFSHEIMFCRGRQWIRTATLCMVLLIQVITGYDVGQPATSIFPDSAAITSFSPGGQYIMLTFDTSPHASYTGKILDILLQNNATATFFVFGTRSLYHPHLIKRMIDEGHEVGCRGWNGKPFPTLDSDSLLLQLKETRNILHNITGIVPTLVRPPKGITNNNITNMIKTEINMNSILWNFEPARVDGKLPKFGNSVPGADFGSLNSRLVLKNAVDLALPGDVMYFQDGQTNSLTVLPQIIKALRTNGHEFLTVSEMLSFPDDKPH